MDICLIPQLNKRGVYMKLIMLEPEVAGGLGENTIFEPNHNVKYLHYEFQGWLGDALLESTPCFIVTDSLAKDLNDNKITGYILENVEISKSDEFKEMYPNRTLPNFKRLVPLGIVEVKDERFNNWSGEDLCISQDKYLVVTEKAFNIISNHSIVNCDYTELYE